MTPGRVIAVTLDPVPHMALNVLMRAHHRVYHAHVREISRALAHALWQQGIRTATSSWVPMKYVEVRVVVRHKGLYDPDGKYAAVKPLLDALKLCHAKNNPHGLGVITDDSDGEHGNPGYIRLLEVRQVRGSPALSLELREVAK